MGDTLKVSCLIKKKETHILGMKRRFSPPAPKGEPSRQHKALAMKEIEDLGMHAGAKPEIFRFAEQLRTKMTLSEKRLWEFLKQKPLGYKFRRQHPFSKYILDFYCHKIKLAIEIDGKYHDLPEQKKLDEIRTTEINRLGLTEIRFTNEADNDQFEKVVNSIVIMLKANSKSSGFL